MSSEIKAAIASLKQGKVIAYPTEAVFGLGCDPTNQQAVLSLLELKRRAVEKGLILVAGDFELLAPFVDTSSLTHCRLQEIVQSWPGAVTWVFPKSKQCPMWISGQFDSVAVRVSAHPIVIDLTKSFNLPIVSTSANVTGVTPALSAQEVHAMFELHPAQVIDAPLGSSKIPSKIFDAVTGQQYR